MLENRTFYFLFEYIKVIKEAFKHNLLSEDELSKKYIFLTTCITTIFVPIWYFRGIDILFYIILFSSIVTIIGSFLQTQNIKIKDVTFWVIFLGLIEVLFITSIVFHKYPMMILWFIAPILFSNIFFKRNTKICILLFSIVSTIITPFLNTYFLSINLMNIKSLNHYLWVDTIIVSSLLIIVFYILDDYKNFLNYERSLLKKTNFELNESKEILIKTQKHKEEFYALISHEIRTPMNAIIGISNILNKTKLDSIQLKYLKAIQTAANNLLVIVNDLFDLSKIEAGKLSIEMKPFNLIDSLQFIYSLFLNKAETKGIQLRLNIDNSIEENIIGDQIRVNQILLNLCNNAVKFTETGMVEVKATLISKSKRKQKIKFSIIDTGIGISEAYLSKIFDHFSQEDLSITRKYGGTGIGLNICKHLTEMMGGKIDIFSQKNIGTNVTFTLDFEISEDKDLKPQNAQNHTKNSLKGLTILLVEDNVTNRMVACNALEYYGSQVIEAENGKEAIDLLAINKNVDLILMDLGMPVMGGVEASIFIRKNLELNIPIIALTANALPEEYERCMNAGMNDFILKPFKEHILIETIYSTLHLDQKGDDNEVLYKKQKSEDVYFRIDLFKEVSKGNIDFERKMIASFISESKKTILEMHTAFDNKDLKQLSFLAHRVKSSLQIFEMHKALELAQIIENKKNIYQVDLLKKALLELNEIIDHTSNQLNELYPDVKIL